jgi:hypothetical protein
MRSLGTFDGTILPRDAAYTRAAIISEWSLGSLKHERGSMGILDRLLKKWPLWATLVGFLFLGSILILLPALNDWHWDHGVVREFGIAFLIAAILGGSIHLYLEQDIAKDAFEGAIGYFLPPDVKEAVRSISGIEWFAEEFSWTVELENFDTDLIKVTSKIRKYLKNITHSPLPIRSSAEVDEWKHSEKSYIVECELRTSSQTVKFDPDKVQYNDSTLAAETGEVIIGAGEYVELLATTVQFKKLNDDLHFAMRYATKEAKIIISKCPNGFERWGGFSTDLHTEKDPHRDEFVVKGFCLPWQRAIVRWWPKETQ